MLSPLILPMLMSGLTGNAYESGSNIFVADLTAYTAFPPTHALSNLSAGLYSHFTGNDWEDSVYLGLPSLLLLAWGFWRVRNGERRMLWYALGGMIFFMVLASGDALHWNGATLPVHMPDIVLARLPFFANVRTPARAIVFVYLFLGLGAAAIVAWLLREKRGLASGIGLVALAVLMALDFYPAHLQVTPMACAPELRLIASDPDRSFAVLDLPFGYSETNYYMAQQACHGRPIAQGMVARQLTPTLADYLNVKDLAAQRRDLGAGRIKYILLHKPEAGMFSWDKDDDGDLVLYRRSYAVVEESPEMTVLKVY